MSISVLQNFKKVESYPFPHICIENALPEDIYNELEETFPEQLVCSTEALDKGITYRYKSNPALVDNKISNLWKEFFEYHTSKNFFNHVISIFENSIESYYNTEFITQFNGDVGVRKLSKKTYFVTDCQYVVHEPVDQTGTTRTPHLDNPGEIYAGLLYIKKKHDTSTGGNFVLHEADKVNKVYNTLGRQVDETLFNPVKEVEYKANTFCMFLNVNQSVHSVTPRINPTQRRRSINIIGEFNKTGKMWEAEEIK